MAEVMPGGEMQRDRRIFVLVVALLLALYLLLAALRIDSGDGATIYQVTRALLTGRGFAIPAPSPGAVVVDAFSEPIPPERLRGGGPYGAWGVDGRYYAQYGVGQSLLAVPLYLLGQAVYRMTGWGTEEFVTQAAVMLLNPLVLALMGGVLYMLARGLGYPPGAAVGVALVTGLATPLWWYSKTFFSEPLIALALVVAIWAAVCGAAVGWLVCGVALGMAVLVKPVAIVVAPAFLVYAWVLGNSKSRWQALRLVAGPLAVGVIGVALYNWVRFGSPLDTGYRTAAWDVPPWIGFYGLLLSPGKGLLWYCPPLALGVAGCVPLARKHPRAATLMGSIGLSYSLVHAILNHWHGGGPPWGPRYIVPVIPLLVLPAAEWFQRLPRCAWGRLAMALLLALGLIVQIPAVLVNPARALQALYDRSASPTEYTLRMLYRPADSPLAGQWRSLLEVAALMRDGAARAMVTDLGRQTAVQSGIVEAVGLLSFNAFDLWPVLWGLLGAPPAPMLTVEAVLGGLAVWTAWRLCKETR